MGSIASRGQLRLSFLRWNAVIVPLVLLLGFLSARTVASGDDSDWYVALSKPNFTPPGWVFPVAWSILYAMMGAALALVLSARGARLRGLAATLFAAQLALNLSWTPLFFGAHKVDLALLVIVGIFGLALMTTLVFAKIRTRAAWLMVPYLAWLLFAAALNWRISVLNPDAQHLVPGGAASQMIG